MSSVLPIFFVVAAGLCVSLVLFALWQSLRFVLVRNQSGLSASTWHDPAREALLREKHELLNTIRELRAEHELGKLSESDYVQLEQRSRARAREVLRMLDEQIAPYRERAQAMLEEAISADGSKQTKKPAQSGAKRVTCLSCAAENDEDAVFCKKCGARLSMEAK